MGTSCLCRPWLGEPGPLTMMLTFGSLRVAPAIPYIATPPPAAEVVVACSTISDANPALHASFMGAGGAPGDSSSATACATLTANAKVKAARARAMGSKQCALSEHRCAHSLASLRWYDRCDATGATLAACSAASFGVWYNTRSPRVDFIGLHVDL